MVDLKKLLFIFFFIPLLGGVRGGFSFAQKPAKEQSIVIKKEKSEIIIDNAKIQIITDGYKKTEVQNNDYAIINIYRLWKSGGSVPTYIFINGNLIYRLSNNSKLTYKIFKEGVYEISLCWDYSATSKTCLKEQEETLKSITVSLGKKYYLKFNPFTKKTYNMALQLMEESMGRYDFRKIKEKKLTIIEGEKPAITTKVSKAQKSQPQPDLSFFTTDELKDMYRNAFDKKDYDNVALIQEELSKRAAADQTGQLRGGGDPLKGLNISKAIKMQNIGKYFALIIGIDKYQGDWAPLNNAVRDAIAIKALLKTKYKFDYFRTLYNTMATRENIIKELEWLVENVKEEDNVFIYYSGHGEFVKSLNKGYWVPVDAQAGSTFDYVSNSDIQTFLASINSRHTLLVSDACFSGDIFRGKTISVPFENSEKYYKKVYGLVSRQAITSGGIEPVMDGGRDGHSVFTYYLLKMLRNNDNKYYDAGQLFNDIKIPVTNNSDQSPKLQPIKNTGDEGGQFIFIKKINDQ